MKKKLQLKDLKIQSFETTEVATDQLKGGTLQNTAASCLDYISCNPLQCIYSNYGHICLEA